MSSSMPLQPIDKLRIAGCILKRPIIGPKKVELHIIHRCNVNCVYCWYHSRLVKRKEPITEDMEYDKITELIDDFRDLSVDKVLISGLGEPTLHKDINPIIDYLWKNRIKITMNTNATFCSSFIKSIPKMDSIRINLSSTSPESYKNIYGRDMFYKVLGNISKIYKIRKVHKKPRIIIIFMINEHNFMEIENIIKIGNRFDVDFMEFRFIEPNKYTKGIIIPERYINRFRKTVDKIVKSRIIRFDSNIKRIDYLLNDPGFLEKKTIHSRPFYYEIPESRSVFSCFMGWYKTFIDVRGNVYPCSGNNSLLVGNIYKKRFIDIWRSREYQDFRIKSRHIDVRRKEWYRCRICAYMECNKRIENSIMSLKNRL